MLYHSSSELSQYRLAIWYYYHGNIAARFLNKYLVILEHIIKDINPIIQDYRCIELDICAIGDYFDKLSFKPTNIFLN